MIVWALFLSLALLWSAAPAAAADPCPPRFAAIKKGRSASFKEKALGLLQRFEGPDWKPYRVKRDPTNEAIYELFDGKKPIGHLFVDHGYANDAYANGDVIGAQIDKNYQGKGLGYLMYLVAAADIYERTGRVFRASDLLNSSSELLWEGFRKHGWTDDHFVMRPDLLADPELAKLKKRHLR